MDSENKEKLTTETVGEVNQETTNEDIQRFFNKHRNANRTNQTSKPNKGETPENSVKVHMANSHESIAPDQKAVDDLRNSINNAKNKFMADLEQIPNQDAVATPVVMQHSISSTQSLIASQQSRLIQEEEEDDDDEVNDELAEENEEDSESSNESSSDDDQDSSSLTKDEKEKKKSEKSEDKKKNEKSKDKNNKDKAKDKKNNKSKKQKSKKKKAPKKKKNLLIELIKKYPWICIIICLVLLLLLFILAFIMAFNTTGGTKPSCFYMDPKYDYSKVIIDITDSNDENVIIDTLSLEDLAINATYGALHDKVADLDDTQKYHLYATHLIVIKSKILSIGNYSLENKDFKIKSNNDSIKNCDVYNGCKKYTNNDTITYVSSSYAGSVIGTLQETIEIMPEEDLDVLKRAYDQTKYFIMIEGTLDGVLEEYKYNVSNITDTIIDQWLLSTRSNAIFYEMFNSTNEYSTFGLYNLEEYAPKLKCASNKLFWWPIGSAETDENGLYSGEPTTKKISSKFGHRVIKGIKSYHEGVDIGAGVNKDVIIAAKSGTVRLAKDGCESYGGYPEHNCPNGGYGNYVFVTHEDGSETVYAHMAKNSIVVKPGDQVIQGQKLGMAGSSGSSTGGHLHFEVRINGDKVDPLDYIDPENPRPTIGVNIKYVEGINTKQTVCKTLLASNFSKEATIALMINIQSESSFNEGADGDNGTSYGLCQWHKGRKQKLKDYCQENYTNAGCQLDYLVHELDSGYQDVYQKLLSDSSARDMSTYFCLNFEIPANRYTKCPARATNYESSMTAYVNNDCK